MLVEDQADLQNNVGIKKGSSWWKVICWFEVILPSCIEALYVIHKRLFIGKKGRIRGLVAWHVVVWSLWLERNAVIFQNAKFDLLRIVDLIKCRWSWLSIDKDCKIPLAAWSIDPGASLKFYRGDHNVVFQVVLKFEHQDMNIRIP